MMRRRRKDTYHSCFFVYVDVDVDTRVVISFSPSGRQGLEYSYGSEISQCSSLVLGVGSLLLFL